MDLWPHQRVVVMGDLEKVCDAFADFQKIAEDQGCSFSRQNGVFIYTHRCWVEKLAAQRKIPIEFMSSGHINVQIGTFTVLGT